MDMNNTGHTVRIATWNVNSVRQRTEHLLQYLKEAEPDVLCLQELKCTDDAFPRLEVESAGYNVATHGQKTFNGVAIISKYPIECETRLPGDLADEQSRYIEAIVSHDGAITRVASIYLPNGNGGPEKYTYKLNWMERLRRHAQELLKLEESLVLAGDFNVIPEPRDARTPAAWINDALFLPQTRAAYRELLALGFTDALREVTDADPLADFVPTAHIAIEIGGDGGLHYHYGTLGQLEHGVHHADAYLRTLGKEPKSARPLATWPYPKGGRVQLFVLAGHRNMEGERAFVEDLGQLKGKGALAKDNARIAFRYSLGGGFKVSDGWEPLGPAGCYDTFGPELSFGAALARKSKDDIAIAKFTHSGSQVVDWSPAGSETPSRNLYPAFLEFVRSSMQDLAARGQEVELAGIFYHLGENDMSFAPYRRKAIEQLSTLVDASRRDLALPHLRWFVSQQPPTDTEGVRSIDVTAQLAQLAAADPHFLHIRAFELPGLESPLVITTPGIVALGELLAVHYLDLR